MLHNAHNFSSTIASPENNSSPLMPRAAGESIFLNANAILILNAVPPAAQTHFTSVWSSLSVQRSQTVNLLWPKP